VFRTWFLTANDSYVLQIQNDRLLLNWRRRHGEYPRFESVFTEFGQHVERFTQLAGRLGLGPIELRTVEVSYINWIADLDPSEFLVAAHLPSTTAPEVIDPPAQQQWLAQYAVALASGTSANLALQCASAIRPLPPPPQTGYQFVLTFRAPQVSFQDLVSVISTGRNVIVQTFTDLTTPDAHATWGRKVKP